MKDILEYMNKLKLDKKTNVTLSAQLEGIIGNYFVSGLIDDEIEVVYYDKDIDALNESVQTIDENIVAYVIKKVVKDKFIYEYAFVLESVYDKFMEDTSEYGFIYIPVTSFETKEFFLHSEKHLPPILQNIKFIDDDFLFDENIEFDFKAFELIDSGIKYLNPKHFSIKEFIEYIKYCKENL